MTKQVNELTDIELKSIGYEALIALEQNKTNLQIIQTELTNRANNIEKEVPKKK